MRKNTILSFLLVLFCCVSYSQEVHYSHLIGFTYALNDSFLQIHMVRFNFKDSFNVDLTIDSKVMNLTYKLDAVHGTTLIIMNKGKIDPDGPPNAYLLVKKADRSNLKSQGLVSRRPRQWDNNETDKNTILMVPVGTVSPSK
jgi:hypothetical protein